MIKTKKCFTAAQLKEWQNNNCAKCKKCVVYNERRKYMPNYQCAIQRDIEGEQKGKPVTPRTYNMTRDKVCPMLRLKDSPVLSKTEKIGKKEEYEAAPAKSPETKDAPSAYIPVKRKQTGIPLRMYGGRAALTIASAAMTRNAVRQYMNVARQVESDELTITAHIVYAAMCHNEVVNYTVREAISACRTAKKIYRHQFKKDIKDLAIETAKYDTDMARRAELNDKALDFADGFTDLFIKNARPYTYGLYAAILAIMKQRGVKYPDIVSRFHTASALCAFSIQRLDDCIKSNVQRCFTITQAGYLAMRATDKRIDIILDDLNKLCAEKCGTIDLSQEPTIREALTAYANFASDFNNTMECVDRTQVI